MLHLGADCFNADTMDEAAVEAALRGQELDGGQNQATHTHQKGDGFLPSINVAGRSKSKILRCLRVFFSILLTSNFMLIAALDLQLCCSSIITCNTTSIAYNQYTKIKISPFLESQCRRP